MISKLEAIRELIGNTPLITLEDDKVNLFAKLELFNFTGSVKVRPAYYILTEAIKRGDITEATTVIESSSGNFAIALATLCQRLGIAFIPVIDQNINRTYEKILKQTSHDTIKIVERDETGGYLLNRIRKISELLAQSENYYWTNQYGNPDCMHAHYYGLGTELADSFDELDYAFIGVSSCGTIAGVSRKLKEKFPNVKIIAVDTEGSVIFSDTPQKRYIPGIGSSMVPDLVKAAVIDEVIFVPEIDTVEYCHELFRKFALFCGGSSGSSYYAVRQYFADKTFDKRPTVVFLCPDSGASYVDTIYDSEWVEAFKEKHQSDLVNM